MMSTETACVDGPTDNLVRIGFSEYEAKAYVALLRESPVTGYQLAKISGKENLLDQLIPKRDNRLEYETELYLFGLDWLNGILFDDET